MKSELCSPVATADFSKFAGILSAALSQHHLLGFEIAQLEFHHLRRQIKKKNIAKTEFKGKLHMKTT